MAIETLAEEVGDKETAKLARDIRRDEEKMARYLERLIPSLTKAVVKTEIPAAERRKPATRKRSGSASRKRSEQHEDAQHRQEELRHACPARRPSYLEGMTTAAPDQALEEARWNLDPLVDGKGAEGTLELLAEARERAVAFAEKHRGKVSELDAAGLAAAMHELEEMFDKVGRAGSYAVAVVHGRHRRPRARRPPSAGSGARRRDRDLAHLLRARVERASRRSGRGASRGRRARVLPPSPPRPRAATARTS